MSSVLGGRRRRSSGRWGRTPPERGFRRIVVSVGADQESAEAVDAACRLACKRAATVTVVAVVEVPVELPLDCLMDAEDREAHRLLEQARATADSYGVKTVVRLLRAREAAAAIVEEIERQKAELAIVGARWRPARKTANLGRTVETVLRHAPCRVMLVAAGGGSANGATERASRQGGTA
jgi:nucleotide-binding universal stress UspA family protein